MADNNGTQKKRSALDWTIWGLLLLVSVIIGCVGGNAFDKTINEDGRLNAMAAITEIETSFNSPAEAVINSFSTAFKNQNSYSFKGIILSAVIVAIFFMYTSTTKKRFHRKGEEHGSAKWGSESDKEKIMDKNDLYNNIIYADDVYMVLDRKKREQNA